MLKTLRSLDRRHREAEWMDAPDADPVLVRKSLAFIRRINWLLGYAKATVAHLDEFSKTWPRGQTIRILDIATGSADIPRAIQMWAMANDYQVDVTGIDLQPAIIAMARAISPPGVKLVVGNALQLPFADGSFDYVMTNMFLHHLDEEMVVSVFKEMDRVASRGILAADLVRARGAYLGIVALTFIANPMVRHDGRISVRQAFNRDEMLQLRDRAGIGYTCYYSHAGYRFVLAGEKHAGDAELA